VEHRNRQNVLCQLANPEEGSTWNITREKEVKLTLLQVFHVEHFASAPVCEQALAVQAEKNESPDGQGCHQDFGDAVVEHLVMERTPVVEPKA
jgi:hypothetical protein